MMVAHKFPFVCLNDLTTKPLCSTAEEVEQRIDGYVQVIKKLWEDCGTRKVRYNNDLYLYHLVKDKTLQDYCNTNIRNPKAILLLSTFTKPQVDEDDDIAMSRYVNASATILKDGNVLDADGLLAAYINNTMSVGFESDVFWNNLLYGIELKEGNRTTHIQWPCVTKASHLDNPDLQNWADSSYGVDLTTTDIAPLDKNIHLRDDHGQDTLKAHADRLVNSPYVISILDSLPFKPKATNYIHKVDSEGTIDIVLTKTDRGLSMRVKTTGRDIRETQAIANILQEKYGV